jgi:hypothetical protein
MLFNGKRETTKALAIATASLFFLCVLQMTVKRLNDTWMRKLTPGKQSVSIRYYFKRQSP